MCEHLGSFASDTIEEGMVINCSLKLGGKGSNSFKGEKGLNNSKKGQSQVRRELSVYSSPNERPILSLPAIYPSVEQALNEKRYY